MANADRGGRHAGSSAPMLACLMAWQRRRANLAANWASPSCTRSSSASLEASLLLLSLASFTALRRSSSLLKPAISASLSSNAAFTAFSLAVSLMGQEIRQDLGDPIPCNSPSRPREGIKATLQAMGMGGKRNVPHHRGQHRSLSEPYLTARDSWSIILRFPSSSFSSFILASALVALDTAPATWEPICCMQARISSRSSRCDARRLRTLMAATCKCQGENNSA